ncbi:Holliday junction resolvase RecU [Bacillus sp. JCM 19034]|uniref:Holliday junction resolvase RecU n=1 Tax=Bacillus sp. JCM 19034 TaxID=1481928 RepID=UPI0007808B95|nr:Holliday junction resolvase RecU [Bacillus sp. JCM 19034]
MGHGNRGMAFEHLINVTNQQYSNKGMAIINKRPTPVKVLKSKGTRVLSGYFEEKSTVDYDGIYESKPIVFEAKTTGEKRFPLSMLSKHQYDYLEQAHKNGAIAFLLIEIRPVHRVFLLPVETFRHYMVKAKKGGRKSIPLDDLDIYAYEVNRGRGVLLDYLAVVNKLELEKVINQ